MMKKRSKLKTEMIMRMAKKEEKIWAKRSETLYSFHPAQK